MAVKIVFCGKDAPVIYTVYYLLAFWFRNEKQCQGKRLFINCDKIKLAAMIPMRFTYSFTVFYLTAMWLAPTLQMKRFRWFLCKTVTSHIQEHLLCKSVIKRMSPSYLQNHRLLVAGLASHSQMNNKRKNLKELFSYA